MYIPWKWIREKTGCDNYSVREFTEKLNYYGLECEENSAGETLFINFIVAHNRKDLRSWWGLAREISVLLDLKKSIDFFDKMEKKESDTSKSISNLQFIIRSEKIIEYNAVSLHNLIEKENLPAWILQSLTKNGIRSINSIVDIANFVMLETGQPLHVFDLEKLKSISLNEEIVLREAKGKEPFIDLSGRERELSLGDLIMESSGEVVELLGIIGGANTTVSQKTKQILVESGNFSVASIESTCNNLGIKTRASEKSMDFYSQRNSYPTIRRFKEIIKKFYNYQENKTEYFLFSQGKEELICREVKISRSFIEKKIGILVPEKEIEKILKRLAFPFRNENDLYIVKIPSFRSDIKIKEDLLEEIGKLLDYNLLPGSLPLFQNEFVDPQFNNIYNLKRKIALYLISNGYQEILSYSLVRDYHSREDNKIIVSNPRSNEHAIYRTSFINSHLEVIKHNQDHGKENFFFFEIGNVYRNNFNSVISEEILSIIATGKMINSHASQLYELIDIYWIKGLLENLLQIIDIEEFVTIERGEFTTSMDVDYPLVVDEKKIGFIRQLSSKTLLQKKIKKDNHFLVLQLSLSGILPLLNKREDRKYFPISYLPVVVKNISFFIKKSFSLMKIKKLIKEEAGEFLLDSFLVDIYDREKESPFYSLNFQLLFQGKNSNLKNTEIEVEIEKIWQALAREFSVLRR